MVLSDSSSGPKKAAGTLRRRVRFRGLALGLVLLAELQPAARSAQPADEAMVANDIRSARVRLKAQQPGLGETELERLAEVLGRSNYLARAIEQAYRRNDFTNADLLLKEFPGTVDDLGSPYSPTLLFQATQMRAEAQVKFLLGHKADPNRAAPYGGTPLSVAVMNRHWATANQLVEARADVTRTNEHGQTPLGQLIDGWWSTPSVDKSQMALLTKMLAHGADPFAPSDRSEVLSILEAALMRQQIPAICDLLLTNRASVARRTPGGDTALHLAAVWGRTNAIEFLCEAGFSIDQTNSDGLTPLQRIADFVREPANRTRLRGRGGMIRSPSMFGSWPVGFGSGAAASPGEVAEMLLGRGVVLDVFCAAALGRTNELASMLRDDPALAKARDGLGRTPLHYAANGLQLDTATLLLQAGAAVSSATTMPIPRFRNEPPISGRTSPLHLAALRGNQELTQLLLQADAGVNASDQDGNLPLHFAARLWQTNLAALLIAAHSGLEVTNRAGQTPLRAAVESGAPANADLLLSSGARLGTGLGSNTLMHIAAERGDAATLEVLRRHGLPVDGRDGTGTTPFQRAVMARQWNGFNWLRSKGVDINAQDADGNTALHQTATLQDDGFSHQVEPPLWDRWKQQGIARGGLSQQLLSQLIRWKLVSAPVGPTWTNTSLTAWLLVKGAKPNLTNRLGQTAMHLLCSQYWLAYDDHRLTNRFVELLVAGAKVEWPDANGLSCLHVAATNAPPAVLALLAGHVQHPDALRDAQGRTPLHYAVRFHLPDREDTPARLMPLLSGGLSPNAADNRGRTPLHEAVSSREGDWSWPQAAVLQTLLTNRANPNVQDDRGFTPLHVAMRAWLEHPNYNPDPALGAVSLLLSNRAEPNLRDRQGQTALHVMAGAKQPWRWTYSGSRLEEVLLNHGWNFAARDKAGETPVHLFAANLDPGYGPCMELLRSLLTNKSLVNLTNAAGDTPLHVALRARHYQTAQILMEAGADPALRNATGKSALRLATEMEPGSGLEQAVKPKGAKQGFFYSIALVDRASFDRWLEAEPGLCSVTNAQGQTPLLATTDRRLVDWAGRLLALGAPMDLLSALRLGRMEEFRRLLSEDARKSADAATVSIPPVWLFDAVRFGRAEGLRDLVSASGDVQAADAEGHSLRYRATARKDREIADWLKEKGSRETLFDAVARGDREQVAVFLDADAAQVNATNRLGRTPLLAAIAAESEEVTVLLLARGAGLNGHTGEGWTALHVAAARGLVELGKMLLRAGADPNELARGGMGPLHLAAACGHTEFAALLLTNGAKVNLRPPPESGYFRNTPLHWAVRTGGAEMVKLLLAHGADPKVSNNGGLTPAALVGDSRPGPRYGFPAPSEAWRKGSRSLYDRRYTETERLEIRRLLAEATAPAGK